MVYQTHNLFIEADCSTAVGGYQSGGTRLQIPGTPPIRAGRPYRDGIYAVGVAVTVAVVT